MAYLSNRTLDRKLAQIHDKLVRMSPSIKVGGESLSFSLPNGAFGGRNEIFSSWKDRSEKTGKPPLGNIVAAITFEQPFKPEMTDWALIRAIRFHEKKGCVPYVVRRGQAVHLLFVEPVKTPKSYPPRRDSAESSFVF